jgi:hypothetical protein
MATLLSGSTRFIKTIHAPRVRLIAAFQASES